MSYRKLPRIRKTPKKQTDYDLTNIVHLIQDKSHQKSVLEAIEIGYLLYPSAEFIRKVHEKSEKPADEDDETALTKKHQHASFDFQSVQYLNLHNTPIVEIGDISMCRNLRILNLSNNYLVNIEPLVECRRLLRLDLQCNQLNELPGGDFWRQLSELKILYLHNNHINRIENLKSLAYCSKLELLTLFDTPVSLKLNYRHHVINSILTLKALDDFVVSDEEIIEDAGFNNVFSAKTDAFKVDLVSPIIETNDYRAELHMTHKLIQKVNTVLSHYSPVLIIQRFARGYLTRKKIQAIRMQFKIVAALKIQKWWRKLKAKSFKLDKKEIASINRKSEPTLRSQPKESSNRKINSTPALFFPPQSIKNIIVDIHKLSRSGFKKENSESSTKTSYDIQQQQQIQSSERANNNNNNNNTNHNNNTSQRASDDRLTQLLREKTVKKTSVERINHIISILNDKYDLTNLTSTPENISVNLRLFLREYFSSQSSSSRILLESVDMKKVENELTNFRLIKLNNSILTSKNKYVYDLVREKVIGVNSIKQLHAEMDHKLNELRSEPVVHSKDKQRDEFITNDARFFQKNYGNMTFGSLRAVDKAYDERNIEEASRARQRNVELLREIRAYSQQQVEYFRDDRIKEARQKLNQDRVILEVSRLREENQLDELRKSVHWQQQREQRLKKQRRRDIALAIDFSKQHLSVSKALQRHEFLTMRESRVRKNVAVAQAQKDEEIKQRELVKKYMEQRNLLRMEEARREREIVEARIKDECEYEKFASAKRVADSRLKPPPATQSSKPTSSAKLLYYDFDSNLFNNSENAIDLQKFIDLY